MKKKKKKNKNFETKDNRIFNLIQTMLNNNNNNNTTTTTTTTQNYDFRRKTLHIQIWASCHLTIFILSFILNVTLLTSLRKKGRLPAIIHKVFATFSLIGLCMSLSGITMATDMLIQKRSIFYDYNLSVPVSYTHLTLPTILLV